MVPQVVHVVAVDSTRLFSCSQSINARSFIISHAVREESKAVEIMHSVVHVTPLAVECFKSYDHSNFFLDIFAPYQKNKKL